MTRTGKKERKKLIESKQQSERDRGDESGKGQSKTKTNT